MTDTIYKGIATSTGDGRAGGRARTSDGLLGVTLAIPKVHSALKAVAAQQKTQLFDSAVAAEVGVEKTPEGGFGLNAILHVELSGVEQEAADKLVEAAHAMCPYSNATRGNIPVSLDVTVA
ncbi:OsmC family protein [Streptomyces spinosirectus]|uniref:OsmC family protein n=1 Tax=Streptomyces TaxID=1883 RepID=UPI001C9DC7DD|nr:MULTISPECIES: OsmC family protein [Streptomyces]MBY8343387.1 OsmC family protein [Streptomyces plumbidurans]UIR22614.1 OsmC family protein [Streptomyces spinosirectus]